MDKPGEYSTDGIFAKMIKNSLDLHCIVSATGALLFASHACHRVLGHAPEDVEGRSFTEFVSPCDVAAVTSAMLPKEINQESQFETSHLHKNGKTVQIEWSMVWSAEDQVFFLVGRDVTERNNTRLLLQQREELHSALVEQGADMLALMNSEGTYTYIGGSTTRLLGYAPEEMVGKSALEFIHPDDLAFLQEKLMQVLDQEEFLRISGFRFKAKDGSWRWIDTTASNQLHNPSIQALVISSRDISDQMINNIRLQENEQKYHNLFEKNPDAVFHTSPAGTVTEVNSAFEKVLGFTREQVLGQPFASFLPAETGQLAQRYFTEALQGGTLRFDLETVDHEGKEKILDTTMYPIFLNGSIIGVETISKDITAMVRAYGTIQKQAQRLNTVLESITDAFFTLDHQMRFTLINSECARLLQIDKDRCMGKHMAHCCPEEMEGEFFQKYQEVLRTGKSLAFETYLQHRGVWLGVKMFPSEDGLTVYMLDITDRVNYQRELKMLSLVASKTINGVVIMNGNREIEWVNEGFTNMNQYTLEEVLGKRPSDFLQGPNTSPVASNQQLENYKSGATFSQELLNYRKDGTEFWVRINVTPVQDAAGNIIRYIALQTDISAQKKADESQARLTQELYLQNQNLQQFTYIVSHNLRAPVANAIGLAGLLNVLDRSSENFNKALANLDSSVQAIDAVLKDLSIILSVGFSKGAVGQEPVPLAPLVWEATQTLLEQLEAFGGEIHVEISDESQVLGNRAYLFSVFHNLISNAIKYRSQERLLKITVRILSESEWVVVSVKDNGSGFDEDKAAGKVFKLYKRFHRNVEGRGLGLFLVKTQIEAMGGEIKVSSQLGVGTRFLIHLKPASQSAFRN
ncbi:PAS domain S-box protein [Rufibacter sp. LB8]|uniref:PAS domain S-box protein n=1 Tax=Rufibacter sp. LB8 TaxID=2777781 RepID=UPI00178C28E9|nr:PAS domain S-box protein [Rufibacter sp. LB8]